MIASYGWLPLFNINAERLSPCAALPGRFGIWSTAFRHICKWREARLFRRRYEAQSNEPEVESAMIDAEILKLHRDDQSAKKGPESLAIGRSKTI